MFRFFCNIVIYVGLGNVTMLRVAQCCQNGQKVAYLAIIATLFRQCLVNNFIKILRLAILYATKESMEYFFGCLILSKIEKNQNQIIEKLFNSILTPTQSNALMFNR